ncbi:MAG: ParB N-terminal domain-containing protein [Novosphingobium sp.]|nr:ParB N-terminal domain-containing protein [Novosphingobium sp.]
MKPSLQLARHTIEYLPIDEIRPDPRNPRAHSKRHIRILAKSIAEFNFNVPVLIDDSGQLVTGHGRHQAMLLLGMTEIAAIRLKHLSDEQRRAFMVADNRLHDLSSWNRDNLASILLELAEADLDFDIELTGFSVGEIDLMVMSPEDEQDRDEALPESGPAVATEGELWHLGDHRLLCADALRLPSYRTLMEEEQAEVVATDPPYNVPIDGHVSGLGKIRHRSFVQGAGEMSEAEFIAFLEGAMRNAAEFSRDGSLHYWAMDWRHLHELTMAARGVYDEQVNLCVWAKTGAGMGSLYRSQHELFGVWRKGRVRHRNNVQLGRFGRSRSNVWSYPGANSFSKASDEGNLLALHPTVKPVALIADILLDCTKRGDIVLDPFLGSGSTIIAAEKVGRRARGLELDPLYVDTIIRRWQRWTGEQARRSDGAQFDDLTAAACFSGE